jgi:hypothetical protein
MFQTTNQKQFTKIYQFSLAKFQDIVLVHIAWNSIVFDVLPTWAKHLPNLAGQKFQSIPS